MPVFSALLRLLLVLALVASGTAGAGAPAMDPAADSVAAESMPPCHEADAAGRDAASPSTGTACCDDGACGCDCLHPPPPLVIASAHLTAPVHASLRTAGSLRGPPGAPASPDIRPPIA